MADKSTNSNNSENNENSDSKSDSDEVSSNATTSPEETDAPVVIEGEAEDVTDTDSSEESLPADEVTDEADDSEIDEDVDDETESVSETKTHPEPVAVVPPPAAEPKRASFVPLVLGGLVAGGIGFFAANAGLMNTETPAIDTSAIDTRFEALSAEIEQIIPSDTAPITARLDALSADVAGLLDMPAPSGDVPTSVIERIEALETSISADIERLNDRFAALEDQVADSQMGGENPAEEMTADQLAAFEGELDELTAQARAQVEEAKAEVEAAKARASELEMQAAQAAAQAERKAAVAALIAAVENGDAFGDELTAFDDPPKALSSAQDGVATLAALQRDFPDAARNALSSATQVPQEASAGERFTAFLKRQTNARSLAPKEGDDVDAVLSRAEASVLDGDLSAAMDELSGLPDDAKDAMDPWLSQAQARLAALAALSELTSAEN